jgi:hypothetical protein
VLEDRLDIGYNDFYMDELDTLYKRTHLINYSISLSTACGFFVCVIIAMLFLGDILNLTLDKYAAFFVLAVLCLIGCFIYLCAKFTWPRPAHPAPHPPAPLSGRAGFPTIEERVTYARLQRLHLHRYGQRGNSNWR